MDWDTAKVRAVLLAGALSVAMAGAACFGISSGEVEELIAAERAAAAHEAEQMAAAHAEVVSVKDAAVAAEAARAEGLELKLSAALAAEDRLVLQLVDLEANVSQSEEKNRHLQFALDSYAEQADIAVYAARQETRWVWEKLVYKDGSEGRAVTGWSGQKDGGQTMEGLRAACSSGESYLYLLSSLKYQDETEYSTDVALDGGRVRAETLLGFGGTMPAFVDLVPDDIWGSKTILLQDGDTAVTYDTAQLLRMFPTVESLCAGDEPAGF